MLLSLVEAVQHGVIQMELGFRSVHLPSNEVARCFSCNARVRGPSGPQPDRDPDLEQRCVSEMKPGLGELFFYETSMLKSAPTRLIIMQPSV